MEIPKLLHSEVMMEQLQIKSICGALPAAYRDAVQDLVSLCCRTDGIRLSYPLEADGEDDDTRHYLLAAADGSLPAVLALTFYDDQTAECTAFTHPAHRRRGYFSRLLGEAAEACADFDILFPVCEDCTDTMATLRALDAELQVRELQMVMELPSGDGAADGRDSAPAGALGPADGRDSAPGALGPADGSPALTPAAPDVDGDVLWTMTADGKSESSPAASPRIIGTCRTFPLGPSSVCLHSIEITPDLRGRGYGTRMLALLIPALAGRHFRQVVLHVSEDNLAAVALYKKAGFRITETLSYYLYYFIRD